MIIAVDFDGTLCSNEYPLIGQPNLPLIASLIAAKKEGCKLILWTCREGKHLDDAIKWCADRGLEFDVENGNLLEMKRKFGSDCRKVYADVYLDDKNIKENAFISLFPTSVTESDLSRKRMTRGIRRR